MFFVLLLLTLGVALVAFAIVRRGEAGHAGNGR